MHNHVLNDYLYCTGGSMYVTVNDYPVLVYVYLLVYVFSLYGNVRRY
jgi:hypothetical protein